MRAMQKDAAWNLQLRTPNLEICAMNQKGSP